MTYYCNNCKYIIGIWDVKTNNFIGFDFCAYTISKNFSSIRFLNCKNCNKFIGIKCYSVCNNCFGKEILIDEEKLKKWFEIYKKTLSTNKISCKNCDKKRFRWQYWYFKELTFIKNNT